MDAPFFNTEAKPMFALLTDTVRVAVLAGITVMIVGLAVMLICDSDSDQSCEGVK